MSSTEPLDETAEHDENEFQGFDAFWAERLRREAAERGQAPTEVIRGVTIVVPQDVSLMFERKMNQMKTRSDDGAYKELLAALFGVDVLDAWTDAGMGGREFRVVLAWGMSHGKGQPVTFQEAYDLVMAKDEGEDDAGKASSSTRASGGSGGSGGRSKRTSGANTGSTRKR